MTDTPESPQGAKPPPRSVEGWGIGLALGTGIGVSLGISLDNLAVGIGIGVAIGLAFALAFGAGKKPSGEASAAPTGQAQADDDPPAGDPPPTAPADPSAPDPSVRIRQRTCQRQRNGGCPAGTTPLAASRARCTAPS
ncbi:MAG: hypothetical protein ACRDT9_12665, partial [Agromyces sp.]